MKFLNHRELKVEKSENYNTNILKFNKIKLGDLKQVKEISESIDQIVATESKKPFFLIIKVDEALNAEKELLLFNLSIYANTKNNDLIRSEARLSIPEEIENNKCASLPLQKLINGTPYHNMFQVEIRSRSGKSRLY